MIATATRYELVMAGRFITGFCVGLCLSSVQVYVNQIVTIAYLPDIAIHINLNALIRLAKAVIRQFVVF